MWEKEDLQQASWRDITFDFVDVEDGFKKSVARFDYPYADGSDLEDMGLEARTVRLKAVFFGETYGSLSSFVEALKEQGAGDVVHPVFGKFQAIPETVSIRHDERAYLAEVDISFVEHRNLSVSASISKVGPKVSETSDSVAWSIDEANACLEADLADAGIPEDITTADLGTSGYMSAIAGYESKVREAMRDINAVVSTVKGYIDAAAAPFKLITGAVSFATNLPGTILSSFAGGIENVAGAYLSLINAPGKFMDSLDYGLGKIEDALGDFEGADSMKAAWSVSRAAALASAAAVELAADEAAEDGAGFNLKQFGADAAVLRTQLLTIDGIDRISGTAREAANAALAASRAAFGDRGYDIELAIKAQALLVHRMADTIRLRREKIIEYEVASPMPLHLVAFRLYGDMGQADRLLRINNIRNPNFIEAGTVLRVYA